MKIGNLVQYKDRWKETVGLLIKRSICDEQKYLVLWGDGNKALWENHDEIVEIKADEQLAENKASKGCK